MRNRPGTRFWHHVALALLVHATAAHAATTLVSQNATWHYAKGSVEASDPRSSWRELDFDDSGWNSAQAPFGYGETGVNSALSDMRYTYSSFFLRKTFSVTTLDSDTRLRVSVNYDDGFIVWINGQRVADSGEPDGAPLHDSFASKNHEYGTFEDHEEKNAENFLELGENVIAIQVFNVELNSSDCYLDAELVTYQKVSDTTFSHDRGFYDSPFVCTIRTETPSATIKYTLNGSDPLTSGSAITVGASTATVTIDPDSSTDRSINGGKAPCVVLRACALKGSYEPTDSDAQTYVFHQKVPYQGNLMSSENWIPGENPAGDQITRDPAMRRSTLMDSEFRTAPHFSNLTNSLRTLPTLSICANYGDIFGDSHGVWHNSLHYETPEWERAASVEWIEPDGAGFQANVAMHCSGGGANRDPRYKTQVSLTFEFKSAYGQPRLDYPLFPNAKSDSINGFRIRAQASDAWGSGQEVQMVRENFARQTMRELDWALAPDERWAHVYVNGMYWGTYLVIERLGVDFLTRNLGGEKADYDVIGSKRWYRCVPTPTGTYRVKSGDNAAWEAVRAAADAGNYTQVKSYMNVGQYIDYHILEEWGANHDWAPPLRTDPGNNYRAARKSRNRTSGDLQWNFFVWDYDYGIRDLSKSYDTDFETYGTWSLHLKLKGKTDYKALFADRLFKNAIEPDGLLHADQAAARYAAVAAELEPHVVAHLARWGWQQSGDTALAGKLATWQARRDGIMSGWCAQRAGYLVVDYKNAGVYPTIEPPVYTQHGGTIASGFRLTMTNPNGSTGTIYYKLDGTDPRADGGAKASGAIQYSGSVALGKTTHVKARVYKSNATWSALHAHTFNYTAHHPLLRITEIHYNPLGGGEFEFVELQNVSGSTTIGLSEMTFDKGIDYTFAPGAALGPGKFAILVRNHAAFTSRHPSVESSSDVQLFGVYRGKLDNGGERLQLVDSAGALVASVRYNDKAPWPEQADGEGFSLVYMGADHDQDDPAKWRASNLIDGSPGYDEGPAYRVVINEALTHTDLPAVDTIELYNEGVAAVDIGGWWLSDSDNDYKKYALPSHLLGAGGYKLYDEGDFGSAFRLSSHGDEIYLTKWDTHGNLQYLAEARFGGAENGRAFGRHITSDGDADFVAQSEMNTLGAANATPLVGPVVINELMYHPAPGGDEFIELQNISGATVPLYDPANPTNTWRLDGAVEYTFPESVSMAPGEIILVVATNSRTGFRDKYGVPADVQIFKQYTGVLNNGGESVKLWRPDTPDTNGVPWILVDRVKYNDNSPWPESPDGDGPSLERIAPGLYGNDPANWAAGLAADGTPGAPNAGVLVARTAGWRYHDQGANLGTAWRETGYDDSHWDDGNAPLGYPATNPDLDTELAFGDDPADKHVTTYFRTRFMLGANPADLTMLKLRARYDDGYVAYLNGQEVARADMPTGTINYDTLASASNGSGADYEEKDILSHKTELVQGLNVLAVELHQVGADSSDIFMDLDLRHTAALNLDPPAAPGDLQAVPLSTTEIRVTWRDNSGDETGFKIDRRQSGTDPWVRIATPGVNATAHTDSGLATGTTFYYKVKAYNAAGSSAYGGPVSATTPAPVPPALAVSTTNIEVSCTQGTDAADETFQVWNSGGSTLDYQVSDDTSKLSVSPTTGSSTGSADKQTHTIGWTTADLAVGVYDRSITVADDGSGAGNGPLNIAVRINVLAPAPFTAYNDLCWADGETTANITTLTINGSGLLVDYETGNPTPATLTVTGGGGPYATQGAGPNAGTDAHTVFDGKVGLNGLISYSAANLELAFSGLNSALRYELVLFGNRDRSEYTARTTTVLLSGAEPGFRNQSTAGTSIGTSTAPNDTTVVGNGYNTVNGHVARYTAIDPGSDGSILLTVSDETSKFYANALMLRATEPAPDETVVARAGAWRYRKGTAEASSPPTAWHARTFDDSAWPTDTAPFGYGSAVYGTTLDMRNSYPTVFFRKSFAVSDAERVNQIALEVTYDDGFILWLNGQELIRHNVQGTPGEFVAHDQTCSGYNGSTPGLHTVTLDGAQIPALLSADNVLAVQLFNNTLGSSDAYFDAELVVTRQEFSVAEDTDANGLIDAWEAAQGTTQSGNVDEDGDGLTNYEEWIAGSGATDSNSTFAVGLETSGADLLVSLPLNEAAGPGYTGLQRRYALESRAGLQPGAVWTAVPGYDSIPGSDGTAVYTNPAPDPQAVYRGRVWLE